MEIKGIASQDTSIEKNRPIQMSVIVRRRVHIVVEINRGNISALSAGAYSATLYVIVTFVKGVGRAPPPSPVGLIFPS